MATRFASYKRAFGFCDICGQRYDLKVMRKIYILGKLINTKRCPECWDPDHPQLQLGMYPVDDPQALRNPRRDTTYVTSGVLDDGSLGLGSRQIQWGWNPVGGSRSFDAPLTPNDLVAVGQVGTVTIVTS